MGRFFHGMTLGGALATAFAVVTANTCFAPPVTAYPEYRQVNDRLRMTESECLELKVQLANANRKLNLDTARRAQRDPVNPGGAVVPVEDRIPVPVIPYPVAPVKPN